MSDEAQRQPAANPAQVGTAIHRVLEIIMRRRNPGGLDDAAAWVADTETIPIDLILPRARAGVESALIQEALTAERVWPELDVYLGIPPRDHAAQLGRSRSTLPRELDDVAAGTIDLVFSRGPDLVVVDYKAVKEMKSEATGYRNQLLSYAAMLEALTGKRVVEVSLLHIPEHGPARAERVAWGGLDGGGRPI